MKSQNIYLISFLVIILFSACKKKDEIVTATIEFSEPLANDTIALGEEIHAEGTIKGTGEKHGYSLVMKNQTTGLIVFSVNSSSHAENFAFHEHWVNDVAQISTINVTVETELGHAGEKVTKTVSVTCLPY